MESTPTVREGGRGARERILAAAEELFYGRGVNATGMAELAASAHVSKRTLYQQFATKDELIEACLRRFQDDEVLGNELALRRTDLRPRERLLALFTAPAFGFPLRGCIFSNTAVEIADKTHPVREFVADHKRRFAEQVVDIARQAGASDRRHSLVSCRYSSMAPAPGQRCSAARPRTSRHPGAASIRRTDSTHQARGPIEGRVAMTITEQHAVVEDWTAAIDSHDLVRYLAHFNEDAVLRGGDPLGRSPAQRRRPGPSLSLARLSPGSQGIGGQVSTELNVLLDAFPQAPRTSSIWFPDHRRQPHGPRPLIDQLRASSPDFATLWADQTVAGPTVTRKVIHHPEVGRLELTYQTFDVRDAPGQQLTVATAVPATSSADALSMLGSLHATRAARLTT